MPGIFSKSTIEELRARSDIVEVIGATLDLKRAGSSFKALCPFHKEKTPSFHINPQRQTFHCFGCAVGGDVFRFTQEYEGVDFPTAVRLLAERAGMQLEFDESGAKEKGPRKDLLYKVLDQAASHYQSCLKMEAAAAARDYLDHRQIDGPLQEQFRIGFASDQRGLLRKWAQDQKISNEVLEGAGLIARSEEGGNWYERFRGRVMFSITDERGRVLGFSGRILDETAHPAKYINSPETPVFRKSRILYGLDHARQELVNTRLAILCEGQIDAIRCHSAGIANAVASQGTALTEEHARIVKRYADRVVLLMDADTAGQDAAIRSAEVFLGVELDVRIAALPPGEDPDSLILAHGRDALLKVVNEARSVVDFQIGILEARTSEAEQEAARPQMIREVLETIGKVPAAVQRDQMLRAVAQRYFVDERSLREDLERMTRKSRFTPRREEPAKPTEQEAHPALEITLLQLMIEHDETVELVRHFLPLTMFSAEDCRRVADAICRDENNESFDLVATVADQGEPCIRLAGSILAAPSRLLGEDPDPGSAAKEIILRLYRMEYERQRAETHRRIQESEGENAAALVEKRQHLTQDLHRLKQGWEAALPLLEMDA
jgi:DNA primase